MSVNTIIALKRIEVGCTEAAAADGSDLALAGAGSSVFVPCDPLKDKIQRYGLACF